jgi:hypothetical protein
VTETCQRDSIIDLSIHLHQTGIQVILSLPPNDVSRKQAAILSMEKGDEDPMQGGKKVLM